MSNFFTVERCFVTRTKQEEEEIERIYKNYREIISTDLPRSKGWSTEYLFQYQGFWFRPDIGLEGVMWIQQHFKPRPTDVYLTSSPKSGTTWLKALVFSIMNRTCFDFSNHPLLTTSPHDCVPFMELDLFKTTPIADPEVLPSPRVFATHIPYSLLPQVLKTSNLPIVYICRDPKDVFVSLWHFVTKLRSEDLPRISLEEAFDLFCEGKSGYGPYWDHVLEYWKVSLESPEKVLFLKYEDMKKDQSLGNVKKLAEFLGRPFSKEEEKKGVDREIFELCSFENMKKLEVNKTGEYRVSGGIQNNVFYREGKVGDWRNHLTIEMVDRLNAITEQKLGSYGLRF